MMTKTADGKGKSDAMRRGAIIIRFLKMDEIERWFRLRSKWLTLPPMDRGPEEFQERLKTSSFIGVPGSHRQWVWPYLVMTHVRILRR